MFHHWSFEAVLASYIELGREDQPIRARVIENEIVRHLSQYMNMQQKLVVEPPLFIMLNLLEVASFRLSDSDYARRDSHAIDRNDLIIPEVMMEEFGLNPHRVMRPIFVAIWNAGGYERDPSYDDEGNWRKSQQY